MQKDLLGSGQFSMIRHHNQGLSCGRSSRCSRAVPDYLGTGSHVLLHSTSSTSLQAGSWGDIAPTWDIPNSPLLGADVDWGNLTNSWGNDPSWGTHDSEAEGWPSMAAIASLDWSGWNDWEGRGMHVRFYSCTFTYTASMTGQFHPLPVEASSRQ